MRNFLSMLLILLCVTPHANAAWTTTLIDSGDNTDTDIGINTPYGSTFAVSTKYNSSTGVFELWEHAMNSNLTNNGSNAIYSGRMEHPSIVIDENVGGVGAAYISYYDPVADELICATTYLTMPVFWGDVVVDSGLNSASNTSIALDSNGYIHITYYDATNNALKYATNSSSGAWSWVIIDSAGDVGKHSSIAIDSNDKVHISYYGANNNDLFYMTNQSGGWVKTTIDSVGNVGKYSSIDLTSGNLPRISYYDTTSHSLKWAYKDTSGVWNLRTIDSSADVGKYSAIAIDSSNKSHISYYDATNQDLKYATNASGSWVTSTIATAGDSGKYTSIAVFPSGSIRISYTKGGGTGGGGNLHVAVGP